jgi:hypothetical protein
LPIGNRDFHGLPCNTSRANLGFAP